MSDKFNQGLQEVDSGDVPLAPDIFGLNDLPPARAAEVVEVVREIVVTDPNALVPIGNNSMVYRGVVMTDHGMEIPPDMSRAEWEAVGAVLKNLEGVITWNIADWSAFAYDVLKISYETIAEDYGYAADTIETYASIARNVPRSIRLISNQPLSFSHARELAPLFGDFGLQEAWAVYIIEFGLTVEMFKIHKWLLSDMLPVEAWQWIEHALSDGQLLTEYAEFANKLARRNRKPAAVIKRFDQNAAVLKRFYADLEHLEGKQHTKALEAARELRAWAEECLRRLGQVE